MQTFYKVISIALAALAFNFAFATNPKPETIMDLYLNIMCLDSFMFSVIFMVLERIEDRAIKAEEKADDIHKLLTEVNERIMYLDDYIKGDHEFYKKK